MFITGPSVIKAATGEAVSAEELGGALVHNQSSGVSHFLLQDERSCFQKVKDVLSYLPSNHLEAAPMNLTVTAEPQDKLLDLVPVDASKAYDVKAVIRTIVDENSWLEIHKYYARNAVVGLARLNGETIGIVANQPKVLAGCLDIDASDKIARFVRFCDAFHLPIVNLIDVPGYLPGVQQEHDGIIRHGAKILYAYAEATVPKFAVVLRKAYGGGYIALVSKALGYDQVLAWPSAELAVMGAEQAVAVVHHRELAADGSDAFRAQKIAEYRDKFLNPYLAAEQGQVDSVIDPTTTRALLISSLAAWRGKRETRFAKRHGNMPM